MAHKEVKHSIIKNPLQWFDERLPLISYIKEHGIEYRTPKNLSYLWNFGSLAGIALVVQILTGLFLAMHYKGDVNLAFDSVQHIMRDVEWGWLIRNLHMVGASFFFIVVYAHIARGMYYGSYKSPREVLWWMGIVIFLVMMGTAFMGYVLPWGQMSFWGATVITNLLSVIPYVGNDVVVWLWGGYSVGDPTLSRFYAIHFLLPFVLFAIVFVHLWALHTHGSNNPEGIDLKKDSDKIPFHPYYTVKDIFGLGIYLIPFLFMVFYMPEYMGHPDNYIPANPLVTPAHIVPEWYFLPFYAILRAIPIKELGVIAMFGSIVILFVLPWLDNSPVRSAKYRPVFKQMYWIFIASVFVLGWVGGKPPEGIYVTIGRVATVVYFSFFLLLPFISKIEKCKPLPKGIGVLLAGLMLLATPAFANSGEHIEKQDWAFKGMMTNWDKAKLYRGYTVATQVCMNCHSLKYISHRTLMEKGGFSEREAKQLAKDMDMDLSAKFISGLDAESAQESYGKIPPDLSMINKAREGGADYIYAVLTGYSQDPEAIHHAFPEGLPDGANFNLAFPGNAIAMPEPLTEDAVEYADETPATVEQMAKDMAYFLQWTAEPELPERNKLGVYVLLYVLLFAGMAFFTKKAVWKDVH